MHNQLFFDLFQAYLTAEKRASCHTVVAYKIDLSQFALYLSSIASKKAVTEVTPQDLRGWIMHLAKKRISPFSINRKIATLRTFYAFLEKKGFIEQQPTDVLKSLRGKKRLPVFFQEKELFSCLDNNAKFPSNFYGLRDQLILELLYGTGIRLSELITLDEQAVNIPDGTLRVVGKRNKERIVPFPRPLIPLIERYLLEKKALEYHVTPRLIITDSGKPCYPMFIYRVVKKYLAPVIHASQHSPHILRHTFATHMLDKGADLQAIKELLGHASLAATQIYTHNSLSKLKEIFKKAHPRAEDSL